jgi:hypothetical protein
MNFKTITNEIWIESEMAHPYFLFQTPFSIREVEDLLSVNFEEQIEEGLGSVFYCFIAIDNKQILLKGFDNKDLKEDFAVCAYMHSNELSPQSLIDIALNLLSLKEDELLKLGEYLESPKYILSRLDDNNNEVEISRFHEKNLAEYLRKRFEDKGHKQDYYVQEII